MEEYFWIEKQEALQLEIPPKVIPLSTINTSTRMQAIVEEDLRLRAGEFGIWIQLDNEVNHDNHLMIRRLEEGNWVKLQAYPSNRSIHLFYPRHEGKPPLPNTSLQNID